MSDQPDDLSARVGDARFARRVFDAMPLVAGLLTRALFADLTGVTTDPHGPAGRG